MADEAIRAAERTGDARERVRWLRRRGIPPWTHAQCAASQCLLGGAARPPWLEPLPDGEVDDGGWAVVVGYLLGAMQIQRGAAEARRYWRALDLTRHKRHDDRLLAWARRVEEEHAIDRELSGCKAIVDYWAAVTERRKRRLSCS